MSAIGRINASNAREYAAKAQLARKQAIINREELLRKAAEVVEQAETTPKYLLERLSRVRVQLDRIDSMMLKESDPGKLDRLASAQTRLSEQERILSGRPLPGSRKPAPERSTKRSDSSPQPLGPSTEGNA